MTVQSHVQSHVQDHTMHFRFNFGGVGLGGEHIEGQRARLWMHFVQRSQLLKVAYHRRQRNGMILVAKKCYFCLSESRSLAVELAPPKGMEITRVKLSIRWNRA